MLSYVDAPTALIDAIASGKEAIAAEMIMKLPDGTFDEEIAFEGRSRTLLMWASATGNVHAIKVLLQRGAAIDARSTLGGTPLMIACQEGQLSSLEILLSAASEVDGVKASAGLNVQGSDGATVRAVL